MLYFWKKKVIDIHTSVHYNIRDSMDLDFTMI